MVLYVAKLEYTKIGLVRLSVGYILDLILQRYII